MGGGNAQAPTPPPSFLLLGVKETMTAPATTSSQIKNMISFSLYISTALLPVRLQLTV